MVVLSVNKNNRLFQRENLEDGDSSKRMYAMKFEKDNIITDLYTKLINKIKKL